MKPTTRLQKPRSRAVALSLLLALLSVCVAAPPADARPGGGQSFSGSRSSSGSSSRGSGSSSRSSSPSSRPSYSFPSSPSRSSPSSPSYVSTSSGDSSLSGFFFFLLIGGAVLIGVIVLYTKSREGFRQEEWSTADGLRDRFAEAEAEFARERAEKAAHQRRYHTVMDALAALKSADQDFSLVLFEDFLYALYAEVQAARGGGLDKLTPYVSEQAQRAYAVFPVARVEAVVIGSMRIEEVVAVTEGAPRVLCAVQFEVNYTEVPGGGAPQSYYTKERWRLSRSPDAKSRPPDRTRVFGCPNCGAPLDKITGRTCSYCAQTVDTGEFDWLVTDIDILERETRGPMLVGTVEEVGTDAPTVIAPDVKEKYQALSAKDPALSWAAFVARVEVIFKEFQVAWSSQEPMRVRPYLSDNLFQFQLYWVEAYKREGLRNITEGARIATIQLSRVVSDRYFDAITVRVLAESLDYTLNSEGEVVGGSRSRERAYSEYWTLIRGAGKTGAPRTDPVCPNCGAGLDINMAGHCAYCKAKVTSGEFDWVLSRIEQDEVYA
jgi:hypothetical protein